jgi:hypothetical protein
MLLRFQKAAVRGNYETGSQAFSLRLRFLTIRDARAPGSRQEYYRESPNQSLCQVIHFVRVRRFGEVQD